MLTAEMNQRMTGTGPGTPGGSFLRSYWFPIAAVADLDTEPVQPIRLLGEDLTLFRTLKGELGLIAQRCAHRALPLMYGIPDETGLRCAYHGWIYNTEGRVVDMPFEPACLPLQVTSYPVEALGGLVFTYMGPEPRPLLPRWEAFVREGRDTRINFTPLPCNYVQCMDNSMDPVHFEYLHGHYGNYLLKLRGQEPAFNTGDRPRQDRLRRRGQWPHLQASPSHGRQRGQRRLDHRPPDRLSVHAGEPDGRPGIPNPSARGRHPYDAHPLQQRRTGGPRPPDGDGDAHRARVRLVGTR